jgi:hypothetical protein
MKMSNVIAFLESLGQDASKARLTGEDYAAAVDALALDDAPRQALLDRDALTLGQLSGGRLQMMCVLLPADGDDNKKDDDQDGQDEPGEGDQKESIRQRGRH